MKPLLTPEKAAEFDWEGAHCMKKYLGHLMRRTDSLEKTLVLGKIGGGRRRGQQRRWLDGITDSMDMNLGKLHHQAPLSGGFSGKNTGVGSHALLRGP